MKVFSLCIEVIFAENKGSLSKSGQLKLALYYWWQRILLGWHGHSRFCCACWGSRWIETSTQLFVVAGVLSSCPYLERLRPLRQNGFCWRGTSACYATWPSRVWKFESPSHHKAAPPDTLAWLHSLHLNMARASVTWRSDVLMRHCQTQPKSLCAWLTCGHDCAFLKVPCVSSSVL